MALRRRHRARPCHRAMAAATASQTGALARGHGAVVGPRRGPTASRIPDRLPAGPRRQGRPHRRQPHCRQPHRRQPHRSQPHRGRGAAPGARRPVGSPPASLPRPPRPRTMPPRDRPLSCVRPGSPRHSGGTRRSWTGPGRRLTGTPPACRRPGHEAGALASSPPGLSPGQPGRQGRARRNLRLRRGGGTRSSRQEARARAQPPAR
jgi:hypothetical protein